MQLVASAIIPIILILGLGWALRRWFMTDAVFWRGLEWLTYHVFTPALFVSSITQTDLGIIPPVPLALSLTIPVLAVSALILALRRPLRADGPRITSLLQGGVRLNTYIGLVFATALHGDPGIATFAFAAAVMVPLVNFICVTALTFYGSRDDGARPRLWRELLGNPLIQGCFAGLALNLLDVPLPVFLATAVEMLSDPALVCGTLIAGAAISFHLRPGDLLDIPISSLLKLVVLPVSAGAIAHGLGVGGATLTSIVIITAVPSPPSAYILAARMGGDSKLMASITGIQTVLSLFTVPLVLAVMPGT